MPHQAVAEGEAAALGAATGSAAEAHTLPPDVEGVRALAEAMPALRPKVAFPDKGPLPADSEVARAVAEAPASPRYEPAHPRGGESGRPRCAWRVAVALSPNCEVA